MKRWLVRVKKTHPFALGAFIMLFMPATTLAVIPWLGSIRQSIAGSTITLSGMRFTIPPKYWATKNAGEISMFRCAFGVPLWRAPYGSILLFPHPDGRRLDINRDLARIRAVETEEARSHGLRPNSERMFDTPTGSAVCLESNRGSEASVACYFFNSSSWTLRYNGHKEFANNVYSIVTSARPSNWNATP